MVNKNELRPRELPEHLGKRMKSVSKKNKLQSISFYLICSVILSAMFFYGCESNPSDINLKYDYSLYAYLMIGESIDENNPVLIKKLLDPYKPFNEQEIGVANADVRLFTTEEPLIDLTLIHHTNGEYVISDSDSLIIVPLATYHIQVNIDGHLIFASTTIPNETTFSNQIMSNDASTFPKSDIQTLRDNPLKVSCPLGEERIVYIETYCLEEYQDARFVYNMFGTDYPKDHEAYESPTGGFPRRLDIVGVYSSRESIDPNNILITDYDSMFYFYGKNRLTIYVVDRNYYEYLYKQKGWENGGVTGAYGVFGSGAGKRFYTELIE